MINLCQFFFCAFGHHANQCSESSWHDNMIAVENKTYGEWQITWEFNFICNKLHILVYADFRSAYIFCTLILCKNIYWSQNMTQGRTCKVKGKCLLHSKVPGCVSLFVWLCHRNADKRLFWNINLRGKVECGNLFAGIM